MLWVGRKNTLKNPEFKFIYRATKLQENFQVRER